MRKKAERQDGYGIGSSLELIDPLYMERSSQSTKKSQIRPQVDNHNGNLGALNDEELELKF